MAATASSLPSWDEPLANAAALVSQRNLPSAFLDDAAADLIVQELQKLSHVRLDREQITCLVPSLFCFLPNLTNLYLQQNELTNLKPLENATELRFLTVARNQICALEGIASLRHLIFLDASENLIEHIDADGQLPKSLSFLNVTENPCCELQKGLHEILESSLPNLKELDWEVPALHLNDFDLGSDVDEIPEDEHMYSQEDSSNFATSIGLEKTFQEAWNSIKDTFLTPLVPETKEVQIMVNDCLGSTDEVSEGDTGTDEIAATDEYKNYLGIFDLDDKALQNRGATVTSILANTCKNLKQNCDDIANRSHLRVIEDEDTINKLTKELKAHKFVYQEETKNDNFHEKLATEIIPQEPLAKPLDQLWPDPYMSLSLST